MRGDIVCLCCFSLEVYDYDVYVCVLWVEKEDLRLCT